MGTLYYGDSRVAIPIDDRALSHLRFVILTKFRRGEAFGFSWVKALADGSGRATIWLHPAITLQFEFDGSRSPSLNRQWLENLTQQAATSGGLILTEEPRTEILESEHEVAPV